MIYQKEMLPPGLMILMTLPSRVLNLSPGYSGLFLTLNLGGKKIEFCYDLDYSEKLGLLQQSRDKARMATGEDAHQML